MHWLQQRVDIRHSDPILSQAKWLFRIKRNEPTDEKRDFLHDYLPVFLVVVNEELQELEDFIIQLVFT